MFVVLVLVGFAYSVADQYARFKMWSPEMVTSDFQNCQGADDWTGYVVYELGKCQRLYAMQDYFFIEIHNNTFVSMRNFSSDSTCTGDVEQVLREQGECFEVVFATAHYMFTDYIPSMVMSIPGTSDPVHYYLAIWTHELVVGCAGSPVIDDVPLFIYPELCDQTGSTSLYTAAYCKYGFGILKPYGEFYGEEGCGGEDMGLSLSSGACLPTSERETRCYHWCHGKNFDDPDVCSGYGTCTSLNNCVCDNDRISSSSSSSRCDICVPDMWHDFPYCNVTECFGVRQDNYDEVCNGNGTCTGYQTCDCDEDFYGDQCQYYQNWKCGDFLSNDTENVCFGRGNCTENTQLEGLCVCEDDYYPPYCEIRGRWDCFEFQMNDTNACSENGNCSSFDVCDCVDGAYGAECDIFKCNDVFSNSTVCSGHGDCQMNSTCTCQTGWDFDVDCSVTKCGDFFNNDTTGGICSGNGVCTDYNKCECYNVYYEEDDCSKFTCFGTYPEEPDACTSSESECTDIDVCECDADRDGMDCSMCLVDEACPDGTSCVVNTYSPVQKMNFRCFFNNDLFASFLGNNTEFILEKVDGKEYKGSFYSYTEFELPNENVVYNLLLNCSLSNCQKYVKKSDKDGDYVSAYACEKFECLCNDKNPVCVEANAVLANFKYAAGNLYCQEDGKCSFYETKLEMALDMVCLSAECVEPSNLLSSPLVIAAFVVVPVVVVGVVVMVVVLVILVVLVVVSRNKKRKVVPDSKSKEMKSQGKGEGEKEMKPQVIGEKKDGKTTPRGVAKTKIQEMN